MEKSEINRRMDQALLDSGIARENQESSPNISQNSQTVLERRYLRRDKEGAVAEEPQEMFQRVAQNLSQADLNYGSSEQDRQATQDEFYDVMRRLEFLPNSPTLMNAGRELQQLSACFVLPIDDSLDDIFSKVKETALIHKSGGGTGFSFNRLRPSGDFVKSTGGVASGPASFIRAFDSATDVVKQGGTRRGANMGILNVDHPDVMKFIRMKAQEGALENFNISIAVTREFMEKVKQGEDYALVNPRTGEEAGNLNAREVFTEIVEQAWKTGDPGLIFLDRINDQNPNPHLGRIESTNPCVTGDTLVYTKKGLRRARSLFESQEAPEVATDGRFGQETFQQASGVFYSGIKPVYRLVTQEGYELRLTQDHRVMTNQGWVPAGNLEEGQKIHLLNREGGFGPDGSLEIGEILGWLIGDGTLNKCTAVLSFFGRKRELAQKFATLMNRNVPEPARAGRTYTIGVTELPERNESRVKSQRFLRTASEYGVTPGNKHHVPEKVMTGTKEMQTGFLRGIFSADGHVSANPSRGARISLTSISKTMLQDVQRLLLNLGMASRIYMNRKPAQLKEMPDGHGGTREYNTKTWHELAISRENIPRFQYRVGFLDEFKRNMLETTLESYRDKPKAETFTARFSELVPDGMEEVFDLTESVTHSFIADGLVVSNCGEQPLSPYESCNLGSVNLARMVRHTGRTEIDWEKLERVIRTGVHLLDNVIDMNDYPLPQIEEASERSRRIGLGVMGTADLLIQLGIRYDSEEALELVKEVMSFIRDRTHQASHELAILRGSYPGWDGSTYSRPMRNTAPVTIAPTGTISIIAGASSGIEPLFALAYTRNIMDRTRLRELNPYFDAVTRTMDDADDDLMESLMEQVVQTGSLEGTRAPAWMKDIFRVSQDISPEWHVRMQAAFQEHTDNSVSKTINFPGSATQEDIREAYMLAYETGCNGITVYRDGSKTEQVLSTGGDQQRTLERTLETGGNGFHPAPRPRPRTMSGSTVLVRTGHGNMYTTINVDDQGKPFELFTTVGKAGGCDSAQIEAISRLVSMALRSGQDPNEIYRQLRGITCCPNWDEGTLVRSIPDGVAIALGQYTTIQDQPDEGAQLMNGRHRCPDCNAPTSFREGCQACSAPDCGWNKCD